jgi:hypothetical protein
LRISSKIFLITIFEIIKSRNGAQNKVLNTTTAILRPKLVKCWPKLI